MADSNGRTVGIYEAPDDDLFDRFDRFFEERVSSYSRSERIKEAMEVYLAIHQTSEELGVDEILEERSARHWVASALTDYERRLTAEKRGAETSQ